MKIYNNTNITYSAIEHNSRKNTKQNVPADLEKKMTQYTDTLSISKTEQMTEKTVENMEELPDEVLQEQLATDSLEAAEMVQTDTIKRYVPIDIRV